MISMVVLWHGMAEATYCRGFQCHISNENRRKQAKRAFTDCLFIWLKVHLSAGYLRGRKVDFSAGGSLLHGGGIDTDWLGRTTLHVIASLAQQACRGKSLLSSHLNSFSAELEFITLHTHSLYTIVVIQHLGIVGTEVDKAPIELLKD